MEDGPDTGSLIVTKVNSPPSYVKNGAIEMANFPTSETADSPKVNGESVLLQSVTTTDDTVDESGDKSSNSDCDNLVIDESQRPTKRRKTSPESINDDEERGQHLPQQKVPEPYPHSNPYFEASIFDLSKHYNSSQVDGIPKLSLRKVGNKYAKRKNGQPPLREYAQYLGLQPTVQFKCSRCGSSGYESLQKLNEHFPTCTSEAPPPQPETTSNNSTNFKVIRRVFLCSACGTYYENWNLFLHMREVHKRLICLYCLGMFPHAEKLSAHLIQRHGCVPEQYEDEKSFNAVHQEPCFLMCSDCQMVFTEHDNVTKHKCIGEEVRGPLENGQDVQVTTNKLVFESSATKDGELSITGTVEITNNEQTNERAFVEQISDELDRYNENIKNHSDNYRSDNDHGDNQIKGNSDLDNRIRTDQLGAYEKQDEGEDESNHEEEEENEEHTSSQHSSVPEERKVPKVTLKLPKRQVFEPDDVAPHDRQSDEEYQSDDSEKLTVEVGKSESHDTITDKDFGNQSQESEPTDLVSNDTEETISHENDEYRAKQEFENTETYDGSQDESERCKIEEDALLTAGSDVSINEIELEQPLDKIDIKHLLQKCLQTTITTCLYCNHARRIAVNGKQLGLHAIAEHRFAAIVKSITAEELIPESFNNKIKDCFEELEGMFFSLEDSTTKTFMFECFQCRYGSAVQKDLYQHNRKLHANALLLCTMCKTSFYSYSELLCHLCPGLYCKIDVKFKCFICVSDELPSAFRLVVHLRKKHDTCDVCLEASSSQIKLSNHVWKHKQAHLCYRCGIAYRNKQDINRHLFWKHGTESIECKRCLTKKWPHVYHFCTPPASFPCNECELSFSRASRLMVHKRLHNNDFPYACSEEGCAEKLISKKLLLKHEAKHREPIQEYKEPEVEVEVHEPITEDVKEEVIEHNHEEETLKEEEKPKPKVDVFDLPELNLSESDSSDSEDESTKSNKTKPDTEPSSSLLMNTDDLILETSQDDILKLPDDFDGTTDVSMPKEGELSPFLDNTVLDIWNNFKTYQENIAKTILTDVGKETDEFPDILTDIPPVLTWEVALRDHDYSLPTADTLIEQDAIPSIPQPVPESNIEKSADHDYCSAEVVVEPPPAPKEEVAVQIPKKASSNSSDSDSSSCTCGSNCSCSSSSDSSSSSSDSSESDSSSEEGRRKQQVRREKRRGRPPKVQNQKPGPGQVAKPVVKETKDVEVKMKTPAIKPAVKETPIRESDLDTTETDTDDEFYDKEPQKIANKIIAEKREKLQLAAQGGYVNGGSIDSRSTTPTTIPEEPKKKKSKSKKKKKKKKSSRREERQQHIPVVSAFHPTVAPLTLSIPKHSQIASPISVYNSPMLNNHAMAVNSTPLGQTPPTGDDNSATRASKRRRVPNKFYGYSSDEDNEKTPPNFKFKKSDLPSSKPALIVPPLTIKTANITPVMSPTTNRMVGKQSDMRVQPLRLPLPKQTPRTISKPRTKRQPPLKISPLVAYPPSKFQNEDTDSNSSSTDEEMPAPSRTMPKLSRPNKRPSLYCYCQCPYDEVSEMIACDSDDCAIEWFHFECVNIMVAPRGQWFCPECRKKNQERKEMIQRQQEA